MTDLSDEQREQIDYLRAFHPERGSRWIAQQVGGVSYSTVLRYLGEQRRNGNGYPAPSSGSSTDPSAVVQSQSTGEEVALHQPAETATATLAEPTQAQARPWEQLRVDPSDQAHADVRRLLDIVAHHEGVGVPVLRDLFTGGGDARGPRERFDAAFSRGQTAEMIIQTSDGVQLTQRGRWLIEQEQKAAKPQLAVAQPSLAELRQLYLDSLPDRRRALLEQARALRMQRWERQHAEERALAKFIPHSALAGLPGWRIDSERDLGADNVLAIYPPRFQELGADVYVRVAIDEKKDVCWLRASNGGPLVGIGEGWDPTGVRVKIVQAWLPAVDPTVEPLPTLTDVQEGR